MMGVRPARRGDRARRRRASTAVGANCGRGPERDGADRRRDGRRRAPRACCWSPSPTPACRRSSATTSSTTRRPADMAAHADGPARPRHRPDRRLLRLHTGAPSAPSAAPWHDRNRSLRPGRRGRRRRGRRRALSLGRARPATMRDYHDTEWGVPVRGERGPVRADVPRGLPGRAVLVDDPQQARPVPRGLPRLRRRPGGRDDRRRRRAADARHRHRPQPRQDRGDPQERRGHDRAARRRRARGIRRVVPAASATPAPRVPAEVPTTSPRVGGAVQGAAQARVRLRRPDHDARADGGDRPGRHPPRRLPPSRIAR